MMNNSKDDSSGDSSGDLSGDLSGDSNGASTDNNIDFGGLLAEARKSQNYTIEEVGEYLRISADIITAIENNAIEALPAPTFAQGYIRAYAKFLEISEDEVLDLYNRAVPHDDVSDLKPRSNLPGEASSQSPLIKTITALLVVAGIAAIGFGSFQYYQKKAGVMESAMDAKEQIFTGNSVDSIGETQIAINQNARMSEDGELIVNELDQQQQAEEAAVEEIAAEETGETTARDPGINEVAEIVEPVGTAVANAADADIEATDGEAVSDTIEIIAEHGSWVQVRDANNSRLLYNMLPVGSSKVLVGRAPFRISMGNAKTTRVLINGLEVDATDFIRANNTASFIVSAQGQDVIFH